MKTVDHFNLIDLWTSVKGGEAGYTFDTILRNDGGEAIGVNASRLDRIYCTPEMLHMPEIERKPPIRGSADHLSVYADLITAPSLWPDELAALEHLVTQFYYWPMRGW